MRFRITVDRREDENLTVVEAEGLAGVIEWPTALLPREMREGDVFIVTIEADPDETGRRREQGRRNLENLRRKPQDRR